jgi:ABC-2 type transport system permease protein
MKSWMIALKDTRIAFSDKNALLLMIAAPLLISMIMGAAFGNLGDESSPVSEIPVVIVNLDEGDLGETFVRILADIEVETSEGQKPLFALTTLKSKSEAISQVERGDARGVLYLPPEFSESLRSSETKTAQVEVYSDPSASVSSAILREVTRRIVYAFNTVRIGDEVAVQQLLAALDESPSPEGYAALQNLDEILAEENASFGENEGSLERLRLVVETVGKSENIDWMGYFVPSMSIFFLSFAAFASTRSILEEERRGTLHRLMTTPLSVPEILLGKIGGAFLVGTLQFAVLVAVSAWIFHVHWSDDFLPLAALTLVTVTAMTSLGALLAAFARDTNQASLLGTMVSLVFAILGGNFLPTMAFPSWLTFISKITVNRWALDGFVSLALSHATFNEILPTLGVLLGMSLFYFSLSAVFFARRFVR